MVDDSRTRLLLGDDAAETLARSSVLVLGLGGVGGAVCEMLARLGVGHLTLVDGDVFSASNLNRQLGALCSTLGRNKAEVWKQRCIDINPDGDLRAECTFIRTQQEIDDLLKTPFDAVADAIDDLPSKIAFLTACHRRGIFAASSMGAGGRRDVSQIRTADIGKTFGCPLAKIVRSGLRKNGISCGIPAVFSPETPVPRLPGQPVGSASHVVCAFGLHLVQLVTEHLLNIPPSCS